MLTAEKKLEINKKQKARRLSPPPFTIGACAHLLHLPFRFFDLPAELRNEVYSHLWHSYELRIHLHKDYKRREVKRISHKVSTSIFRVSRQVYLEASAVFYERIRPNVISDIKGYFPNCHYHYRGNSVYTLVQKCAQLRLTVADERGLTTPDTYDGLLDAIQSILESRDQKSPAKRIDVVFGEPSSMWQSGTLKQIKTWLEGAYTLLLQMAFPLNHSARRIRKKNRTAGHAAFYSKMAECEDMLATSRPFQPDHFEDLMDREFYVLRQLSKMIKDRNVIVYASRLRMPWVWQPERTSIVNRRMLPSQHWNSFWDNEKRIVNDGVLALKIEKMTLPADPKARRTRKRFRESTNELILFV
ncbi:hypothetical protein LTS18_014932 [Coniosporium uncinatum]|uniref:Uncharacterized protein n=1 Tax=Coniosporium uncinatum TaxID=93489 RepID=A0ACC3DUV9_9PEZI|nr:hypothetical protein LTS18_014932 [Coniosporium uncinatum]